eukprot:9496319-Pyramimonas_sp.AAC.1
MRHIEGISRVYNEVQQSGAALVNNIFLGGGPSGSSWIMNQSLQEAPRRCGGGGGGGEGNKGGRRGGGGRREEQGGRGRTDPPYLQRPTATTPTTMTARAPRPPPPCPPGARAPSRGPRGYLRPGNWYLGERHTIALRSGT